VPEGRMTRIAICGALFALRPPTYIQYASGQQGSNRIHISSIPTMRPSTTRRAYQSTGPDDPKKNNLPFAVPPNSSKLGSWVPGH